MIYFIRILNRLGILRFLNFSLRNHQGFTIPLMGGIGFELLWEAEPWMRNLLKKISYKFTDAIFVDVGANVGQTMLKVISVNQDQKYIGFEPNPSCINYLYTLIQRNRFATVKIIPVALSVQTGLIDLVFYSSSITDSTASIVPNFRDESLLAHKVPLLNGNDFNFEGRVGMIKIDVEGSEWEVLTGLEKTISNDRPLICCEVLPSYSVQNIDRVERQDNIEKFLTRNQYGIIRVAPDETHAFISNFGIYADLKLSNYLFYPLEDRSQIEQKLND